MPGETNKARGVDVNNYKLLFHNISCYDLNIRNKLYFYKKSEIFIKSKKLSASPIEIGTKNREINASKTHARLETSINKNCF